MSKGFPYVLKVKTLLNKNKKYYLVFLIFGMLSWILAYISSNLRFEWIYAHQIIFSIISLIIPLIFGFFLFVYRFTLPRLLLKYTDKKSIFSELFATAKRVIFIYIAYYSITMLFSILLAHAIFFYILSHPGRSVSIFMQQNPSQFDTFILSSLSPIKTFFESFLSNILILYAPYFYSLKKKNALTSVFSSVSFYFKNFAFSLSLTVVLIFISEVGKILIPRANIWSFVSVPIHAFIQIVVFIIVLFYFQKHSKVSEKA